MTINEGASILLTWLINFIKWNAGITKYKFDQNKIAGTSKATEDDIAQSSVGQESFDRQDQKPVERKSLDKQVNGSFIPSKQMVFDADKVLAPFEATKKVTEMNSPFPKRGDKRKIEVKPAMEPKLSKSVNLEAIGHKAMNVEKQQLLQIIDLLEERKLQGDNQTLTSELPETEEEVL